MFPTGRRDKSLKCCIYEVDSAERPLKVLELIDTETRFVKFLCLDFIDKDVIKIEHS